MDVTGSAALADLADLVERSADPPAVRTALDQLGAAADERVVASPSWPRRSLRWWRPAAAPAADRRRPAALDVLASLDSTGAAARVRPAPAATAPTAPVPPGRAVERTEPGEIRAVADAADGDRLAGAKRLAQLRIMALDLLGRATLGQTTAALADLAAAVLDMPVRLAEAGADGLAVVGMGKLGGRELNYASDVDVMFVDGDARQARAVMDLARRCFRVDANLRPEAVTVPSLARSRATATTGSAGPNPGSSRRCSRPCRWPATPRWGECGPTPRRRRCGPGASPPTTCSRCGRSSRAPGRWRSREPPSARSSGAGAASATSSSRCRRCSSCTGRPTPSCARPTRSPPWPRWTRPATWPTASAPPTWRAPTASSPGRARTADRGRAPDPHPARRSDHRRRIAQVLGYRGTPEAGAAEAFDHDLVRQRNLVRRVHERLYFRPLLDSLARAGRLSRDGGRRTWPPSASTSSAPGRPCAS